MSNSEDSPMTKRMRMSETESNPKSNASSVDKLKCFLIKYIQPDFELLDRLFRYEILPQVEYLAIKEKVPVTEKNEALVNWVLKENCYPVLLDVLKETNQSHLVNYLTPDRLEILDVNPFSVERLVPIKEEMTLRVNWEILLELIDGPLDLSQNLYSIGVLSRRQKEFVSAQPDDIKRNEGLLQILNRGTIGDYEKTIYFLRRSGQQHVADILEGGATARTRGWIVDTIKGTVQRVQHEKIVTQFSQRLSEEDEIGLELKYLGLRTVTLDKDIIFYFHFNTTKELERARKAFDSKEMEASARRDLKYLQLATDQLSVRLEWPEKDFNRCVKYFYHNSSTHIGDLPVTLLDMIICRAYQRVFCQPSEDRVMDVLSSISIGWHSTISKSRLKLARRFYQRIRNRSAIIRINQCYLVENMQQQDVLINNLTSANCLERTKAMFIARKQHNADKSRELLDVIRSLPLEKHIVFMDYLHLTEQHNVANVIEKGGVTIKVIAKVRTDLDILVDKIENICTKRQVESAVGLYDVDLLEMRLDRGKSVVLWLWCRTKDSLDNLRKLHEDNYLHKSISTVLQGLIKSDGIIVHVDSKQFQKDYIVRRMSAKLQGSLQCPNSTGEFQVCSFQDKIYIASGRAIHIFEDKVPYKQLYVRKLQPSRVRNRLELAACPIHKCLYISDLAERCVWKISPANGHQLEKWLSESVWRLSVTSDGKVLVLDNDPTHFQLRIYTSDAELEGTVPMHGDSFGYNYAAVELMPGVVIVQHDRFDSTNISKGIAIMCLNTTGDVICNVQSTGISGLAPYSSGWLVAADQESKQIMMLDWRLKRHRVLLSSDTSTSKWPQFFCYRKDTQELIVNHFDSPFNQFNVYKLSYDDGCE